eukprot:6178859-Pleurochrysis_carterae.AAC.1
MGENTTTVRKGFAGKHRGKQFGIEGVQLRQRERSPKSLHLHPRKASMASIFWRIPSATKQEDEAWRLQATLPE